MSALLLASVLLGSPQPCDLSGKTLRSFSTPEATSCAKSCEIEADCKGYVFISSWNRCFLKNPSGRAHTIHMHSGQITETNGIRSLGETKADYDCNGKDFKQLTPTQDAAKCAEHCLASKECKSFTYISGYNICWLKKTAGKLFPKTFTCATKTAQNVPTKL